MSFGYKNTFLLDLQSIFSEMNAGFNVSAIKACKLIGIKKDTFYNALENNPTIARYWQKCLEGMLLRDMEREIDLMTKAPETRYQRLLDRYPDLFQNIPHKYIASYLRMTPETLSRLKNS
jgi:CRP-like cAMP-binding protein